MNVIFKAASLICVNLFFFSISTEAKRVIYDQPSSELHDILLNEKTTYIIRFPHSFTDTLIVPPKSVLQFEGGSLEGPIFFQETNLKGDVNIKGSHICGDIVNKSFNASWLCAMDGKTDDAQSINEIIDVCERVFFPKGKYRLISHYDPSKYLGGEYRARVKTHIGINKSNVILRGEEGAEFVTNELLGTIVIFSPPYQIDNSVHDIEISNLSFRVENDGKIFHEFFHVIKVIGVNGLVIKDCRFNDYWGDAIYLSHYLDTPQTGERSCNQNIKILNNQITGGSHFNTRNGISIANGKNVVIINNTIRQTARDDMPGGLDIEPNNSAFTIDNILIEKNIFEDCRGTAGAIGIVLLRDNAPAHNIRIKNNIIRHCRAGISIVVKTDYSTDHFEITGNIVDSETPPLQFVGNGTSSYWIISNNSFGREWQKIPGHIRVKHLITKNNQLIKD